MHFFRKYIIPFILLLLFSFRIGASVFTGSRLSEKATIEQQEEKSSEEKAVEKSLNHPIEAIAIHAQSQSYPSINVTGHWLAQSNVFFPEQFFAIPTPPPWVKS